jgi:hypothetical protein
MDGPQASHPNIKNFNLIGVRGDVLAFESKRFKVELNALEAVEIQGCKDTRIYERLVIEMQLVQRQNWDAGFREALFFLRMRMAFSGPERPRVNTTAA